MSIQVVDHCACGCEQKIFAGEVCYQYDELRFKESRCVAKYAGAILVTANPYKEETDGTILLD